MKRALLTHELGSIWHIGGQQEGTIGEFTQRDSAKWRDSRSHSSPDVGQWKETAVSHVQWLRWSLFRPLDSLAKTTRYIRVGARGSSDAYKRKNRGKEKKLVLWKGLVSSHLSVFALSSSLVASCRCVLWSVEPWQEPAPQSCISTSNTEANDPLQHGRGGTRDYMHASTHTLTTCTHTCTQRYIRVPGMS